MEEKRVDWTVVSMVDSMDDSKAAKTAEWTDSRMVENWDIWMVE